MGFFRKPFVYAGLFTLCLLAFTAYALLDVFVIPHPLSAVSPDASQKETGETAASPAESGETSEGCNNGFVDFFYIVCSVFFGSIGIGTLIY